MTPTPEQIDAAVEAIMRTKYRPDRIVSAEFATAALSAAAEMGDEAERIANEQLGHEVERLRGQLDATIEDCAKLADTFKFLPEYPKGVQAIVAMTIAAAIRARKGKS